MQTTLRASHLIVAMLLLLNLSCQMQCGAQQPSDADILAPQPEPAALRATLTDNELQATATAPPDGSIVDVTVVNNGTRALLVDGDRAVLKAPGPLSAKSRDEVIKPPPRQQVVGDLAVVALSIASIGTVEVIQDHIRHQHSPIPAYYGKDENRRNLAEIRFGPRILFPGETTRGRMWFPAGVTAPCDVTVPVSVHPEGNEVGFLTVRVVPPAPVPAAQAKKPE